MKSYAERIADYDSWHASVEAIAPSSTWGNMYGVPFGWRGIIEDFARGVEACGIRIDVVQAKEKTGGLWLYYEVKAERRGCHPRVDALVDAAEDRASVTCEDCAESGAMRNTNGWMRVLCDGCDVRYQPSDPAEGR